MISSTIDLSCRHIRLNPGEFYFGQGQIQLSTLLGSCVAITLWHPERQLGGMCHYMLPQHLQAKRLSAGFFADGAMALFMAAIKQYGTYPREYQVKMFGASNMLRLKQQRRPYFNVAQRNINSGLKLLIKHGFAVHNMDVGGSAYRQIYLELWNGDVWVKYGKAAANRDTQC